MEDIFEQIRLRHEKQETAFQACKAERDKLAAENAVLRAQLAKREDELSEVNYNMDDVKDELKVKEEMIKRVENDYSTTLAMLVDVQEERDKLREELEREKRVQSGLRDKLEKYGGVLDKVDMLHMQRNVKEETKTEIKFGGMEKDLEQRKGIFGLINLGSAVRTIRLGSKLRPVTKLGDAFVVDLTQESGEGGGGGGLLNLNQQGLLTPTPIKRGRGRPPKRKK